MCIGEGAGPVGLGRGDVAVVLRLGRGLLLLERLLETVSRALTRLARQQLIAFTERGRRDIRIPDVLALAAYVQTSGAPTLLQ